MPRISTYGAPWVGPVQTTNARFRAADNGGGVAGGIAQGLQRLGGTIGQAADVQAEIDADQRDKGIVNFRTNAKSILEEYGRLEGQDAVDARSEIDKRLDELRRETLAGQKNPRVRSMLDTGLKPYFAEVRQQADQHGLAQFKVERDRTWKSRLTLAADDALGEAIRSPGLSAKRISEGMAVFDDIADAEGWSGEALSQAKDFWRSKVHAQIGSSMIQRGDYSIADAYIAAHEEQMTAGDIAQLRSDLKGPMDKRIAADDVGRAMGFVPASPQRTAGRGQPVADGGAIVRSVFPAAVITSTYRPGDHPLSKANPKSWHTQSHAAVDVRPMAGTTFPQFVQGFEKAGYTVIEAKEEVGAGRSKHATGDHWHVVLGGKNAPPSNEPQRIDLEQGFSAIDRLARSEDWEPERRERAIDELEKQARRNDLLINRSQEDADAEASKIVLGLGDGFTDISQLPASVRGRLKPQTLEAYADAAKRNAKPATVAANSAAAMTLTVMSISDPENFAKVGLGAYVGKITPAEMESFLATQAKIGREGPAGHTARIQSDITSTITLYGGPIGLGKRNKPEENERFLRVFNIMKDDIMRLTGGKRQPTEQELYQAFNAATRNVVMRKERTILGIGTGSVVDREKPVYELEASDIPAATRTKIVTTFRQVYGRDPTDGEMAEQFRRGKGRYW